MIHLEGLLDFLMIDISLLYTICVPINKVEVTFVNVKTFVQSITKHVELFSDLAIVKYNV